jgi:hypothetical protein
MVGEVGMQTLDPSDSPGHPAAGAMDGLGWHQAIAVTAVAIVSLVQS